MAAYRDSTTNPGSATTNAVGNAPAGLVDGDFLVAAVTFRSGSAYDVVTPPSGWTLRYDGNVNAGNNRLKVYTKVASGEPASWTWVFAGNGQFIVQVTAIQDPDPTTPYNAGNGQTNGSGTSVQAPTITTTVDGCVLVFCGSTATPATFTAPGGMTEVEDQSQGSNLSTTTAHETQATAGATGTRTATASAAAVNIAALIAVAPIPSGPRASQLLTLF